MTEQEPSAGVCSASSYVRSADVSALAEPSRSSPTQQENYDENHPHSCCRRPGSDGRHRTVPDTVELQTVPDVQYRYTIVNDHTVLVDPGTRRVVQVIE
ncbi:MAG: DUF1236 domain-containing protein [Mesorhizobium sp.]|nr:MAG: DUF1236 domain-containing protein [Mesorhizobium sp.]